MHHSTTTASARSPWLLAFGLAVALQLLGVALRQPLAGVAACLVAPLLAVWVWRAGGPRQLALALVFCWVGDLFGNPRLIGVGPGGLFVSIAAFAVACALLLVLFVQSAGSSAQRGRRARQRAIIGCVYLVLAAIALTLVWGNIGPALRLVASAYLLLIVVMATAAFAWNTGAGIGAGLLLGSHLLIALEIGGLLPGSATTFRFTVPTIYAAGILVIALSAVHHPASAEQPPGTRANRSR